MYAYYIHTYTHVHTYNVKIIYTCIYIYIYTKIKKPKTRCVRVNIKQKNQFSIVTNISVVLHNLLPCIYIYIYIYIYEHMYKYTLQVCCFIWGGVLWYCITWKLQCWNKELSKKIQQNHSVRETWHWAIFLPICTKFLTFPNFLRY